MKKILLMIGLSFILCSQVNALITTVPVTLDETGEATDWLQLNMEDKAEFNISVVSVSTSVTVRVESAFYQPSTSTYFPVSLRDAATPEAVPDDIVFTATGNYRLHKDNGLSSKFIRIKLVSFAGATPNLLVNMAAKRN